MTADILTKALPQWKVICHSLGLGLHQSSRGCQELTTLWVARLDDGAELKVTDPKEQQGDVEEEETEG